MITISPNNNYEFDSLNGNGGVPVPLDDAVNYQAVVAVDAKGRFGSLQAECIVGAGNGLNGVRVTKRMTKLGNDVVIYDAAGTPESSTAANGVFRLEIADITCAIVKVWARKAAGANTSLQVRGTVGGRL
jgi:50S ribosomal subunit-associated GTPase HflX